MDSILGSLFGKPRLSGPKCPKCGSSDTEIKGGEVKPFGLMRKPVVRGQCMLICHKCGYRAIMFRD